MDFSILLEEKKKIIIQEYNISDLILVIGFILIFSEQNYKYIEDICKYLYFI